jgi:hypothetical protein
MQQLAQRRMLCRLWGQVLLTQRHSSSQPVLQCCCCPAWSSLAVCACSGRESCSTSTQAEPCVVASTCLGVAQPVQTQTSQAVDEAQEASGFTIKTAQHVCTCFADWLSTVRVAAELCTAGYKPLGWRKLLQQLQLVLSKQQRGAGAAPAVAAAAAARAPAGAAPSTSATAAAAGTSGLQSMVQELQAVGAGFSNIAVRTMCNNPSCSNVSRPTELQLVSRRGCLRGGWCSARYCCKDCQQQHWKQHRPVCRCLAAAAATTAARTMAAAGAAAAEAEGIEAGAA